MRIRQALEAQLGPAGQLQISDIDVDPASVQAILINEVVPADPAQDFYAGEGSEYAESAIALFRRAGVQLDSMADILHMGIYLTNAAKTPKSAYAIDPARIEESLPWLSAERSLFPHVQVILLMGDVAKKMVNTLAKRQTGRNVIPSGATYKLRHTPYHWGEIRVMPSYVMTGGTLLIEKSKAAMITEDIAAMAELLRQ
ncbi:MAG: uracil-DNA glycosylase [Clostridiales bacterium]|nr:uracil-DNA glycosylase [Clostridiales bacterium]